MGQRSCVRTEERSKLCGSISWGLMREHGGHLVGGVTQERMAMFPLRPIPIISLTGRQSWKGLVSPADMMSLLVQIEAPDVSVRHDVRRHEGST